MAATASDHAPSGDPSDQMTGSPGLARTVVRSAAGGAVLAFGAVAGTLALSGHSQSVSLGVGGMAAVWGGMGFGAMVGGAIHLMHQDHHR